MPAIQPTPAVLARVLDADARIVRLPLPPARLPRPFTTADRLALADWQNRGASGYARVLIEDGRPGTLPDCGAYALVYRPGTSWACWGLTRRLGAAPGIMAWRCSTGATLGLYAMMDEALRALPFVGLDNLP